MPPYSDGPPGPLRGRFFSAIMDGFATLPGPHANDPPAATSIDARFPFGGKFRQLVDLVRVFRNPVGRLTIKVRNRFGTQAPAISPPENTLPIFILQTQSARVSHPVNP